MREGQPTSTPRITVKEMALVFLRLGAISFGGPAGHIALMEHELVRRRGWLSREKFLDLLGAGNPSGFLYGCKPNRWENRP